MNSNRMIQEIKDTARIEGSNRPVWLDGWKIGEISRPTGGTILNEWANTSRHTSLRRFDGGF